MNWKILGFDTRMLLAGFAVLIALIAAKSILEERDAKVRLNAELKATKQLLADKDKQMESIVRTMEDRDKNTAKLVKQIEELKARPVSIREIVREVPHYIPAVSPTLAPPQADAPTAPPSMVLDEASAQGLRQFYLECSATTAKLKACTENETDWKRKELTWQEKEKILEQQRDAAIRTVRGGSKWNRFVNKVKWVGALGVTGVVAYKIGKSSK